MRSFLSLRYLMVFFFIPIIIFSHEAPSIRARSFGGAYRAVASSNDIIFYNPAGLLKYPHMGVDAAYLMHWDTNVSNLGMSLIDAKTTSWGMGLGYTTTLDPHKAGIHLIHLSWALPLIKHRIFLGSSVYYKYDRTKEDYRHFFNFDLALMAVAPLGLSFAVVLDHLANPKGTEKGLGLALGAAFSLEEVNEKLPLTISFDWLMEDLKSEGSLNHVISVGSQYVFFALLPLRIGFMHRFKTHDNFMSLGSGLLMGALALDVVYQQHLSIGKIRNLGMALRFDF